ncbi:hypothetical protein [Dyadobacter sp. 50-39]|uniref:hypothetical protein n=1 Tax=Dyadobacter sp. 50-39 TaxID=1895756 RepID=UPI0009617F48|nr:hypothetical protein [Dyadobacter sp. 50-39]OJV18288.1 MAG: hypothetical protein BGO21_22255 [Dyadobacter sp. 50-39]
MKTTQYFSLGLDYYEIMDLSPADLYQFLTLSCRDEIINWLQWNDPNGVYTDSLSVAEFGIALSKEEGIEIIKKQLLS